MTYPRPRTPLPCKLPNCPGAERTTRGRLYAVTGCGLGFEPADCRMRDSLQLGETEPRDPARYVPPTIRECPPALAHWLNGASYAACANTARARDAARALEAEGWRVVIDERCPAGAVAVAGGAEQGSLDDDAEPEDGPVFALYLDGRLERLP